MDRPMKQILQKLTTDPQITQINAERKAQEEWKRNIGK